MEKNLLTLDSLNARLRRLEDMEEIRDLRMRYHYFINERAFDRLHELYTDDAIVDAGDILKANGIEEIRAVMLKLSSNIDLVKQFIHNHMIDVRGDEASGISYLDARYAKDGISLMVAGTYREKYRRTESGWRISETLLSLFFSVPITKGWAGADLSHIKPIT